MRFFKKIQDWILKSEIIRKQILRFFTQQINPRSFGSRCLKGAEESTPRVDSSVPLIHHDPRDLGLICIVKKRKICFRILSDLRIQSWIFLKKRTLKAGFHWRRSRSRNRRRSRKRAYEPVKIENQSRKRSHKLNGIGVRRIRTFPFLPIPFTTPSLYDPVKTRLSESEAEAEEPINYKARNRTL